MPRPTAICLPLVATALLFLSACIERETKITVKRDGTVAFELKFEGDPGDFTGGDALPSEATGWKISDAFEKHDDDKESQTRLAKMTIPPREPLPDSFAQPGTPEYETSLRFPTELTIEKCDDGTYYHFRRVYEPREFMRYDVYRQAAESASGEEGSLSDKDPAELTDEQRRQLVEALRTIEAYKHVEYVRGGVDAVGDEWPQHYGLILRQAVLDHFDSIDTAPIVALLGQPQSEERDAAIDEFGQRALGGVGEVLERTLAELPATRRQIEIATHGYQLEQARHDATQDLQDENWKISIVMPGEIVAHNGDGVDGNVVSWEFPGKMLNDREQSIMVTSRVCGPAALGRDARSPAEGD